MTPLTRLDHLCKVLDTPESYRKEYAVGLLSRFRKELPEIVEGLRADPAPLPHCGEPVAWRPIETAPKRGYCDVWAVYTDAYESRGQRYPNAYYSGASWFDSGGNKLDWHELDETDENKPRGRKTTHWMPLPAGPVTSPPAIPLDSGGVELPKRPFAFAVRRAPENGPAAWRLFMDEGERQDPPMKADTRMELAEEIERSDGLYCMNSLGGYQLGIKKTSEVIAFLRTPSPTGLDREAVARIIDPNAFRGAYLSTVRTGSKDKAYAKADAILALTPAALNEGSASGKGARES